MKILELKPSQRVKGRYLVKLDDETILRVSEQEIIDYSLSKGKEITIQEAEALEQSANTSMLKQKAMNYLSRKMASRRDVEKKLKEWDATEEEIYSICQRLEEIYLLNDENYARMLAESYHRKGYGIRRIQQEFYKHGIPREMWEEALENEELHDNEEAIQKFLQQKLKGEKPERKELKKVTDALSRRGFSWEEIRSGLLRYDEEYAEEWELD